MPKRRNRTYTSLDGLIARAGRAHEDPHEMTKAAVAGRKAKFVAQALAKNPNLSTEEAQRAGQLLMRAEMARLAQRSAAARRAAR